MYPYYFFFEVCIVDEIEEDEETEEEDDLIEEFQVIWIKILTFIIKRIIIFK